MPTVPADANETVKTALLVDPMATPLARAMLDNGFDFDTVQLWQSLQAARNAVRDESWWLEG